MLELKFAIYYRAASLPSQASYAVLAEESQAFQARSQSFLKGGSKIKGGTKRRRKFLLINYS